jgi:hypothetical protein
LLSSSEEKPMTDVARAEIRFGLRAAKGAQEPLHVAQGGTNHPTTPTPPDSEREGTVPTDDSSHMQDQVLDAIKHSQDAALQAVSAWSESVAKLAPKLPDIPTLPMADALPDPGELSDQFFEFAQQLLTSQQQFVKKLMAALPGQSAPGT